MNLKQRVEKLEAAMAKRSGGSSHEVVGDDGTIFTMFCFGETLILIPSGRQVVRDDENATVERYAG